MLKDHRIFLLRWRLEYSDSKNPVWGMWSSASTDLKHMAAFQKKENLLWAIIEGKNRFTREVISFAEISGSDFVNFEWIAETDFSACFNADKFSVKNAHNHSICGLRIISRYHKISAFEDGSVEILDFDGNKKSFTLESHKV